MKFIGLIPARGGSKGIPLKSIAPCAGRPLLAYTAETALGSALLDRAVLSTDSERIAEVGKALGLEVPFLRPAHLAADDTPMIEVLQHFVDSLGPEAPEAALVLLQPTSPLRKAFHVDEAVRLFLERGVDSLVSVMQVPHQFNPVSVMTLGGDGTLSSFMGDSAAILRRQDKPRVFARNGPAIVITTPRLIREGRLYGPRNLAFEMDATSSLDVDAAEDLAMAELILRREEDARV